MFFPIGDDQIQGGQKPIFTYSLIVANVLIFLYELNLGLEGSEAFITEAGCI